MRRGERFHVADVDRALRDLRQITSFDSIEMLDGDDSCLHALVYRDAWSVELVRGREETAVRVTVRPSDEVEYCSYLGQIGARPLRASWWPARRGRRFRFGHVVVNVARQ